MKSIKHVGVFVLIAILYSTSNAQNSNNWMTYQRVEDAGFSKLKLDSAARTFEQMQSESFMVVHGGNVLLSLGDPTRRFMCHSIRKSFMSAMYGIYIDRKEIALNKTLRELGIQDKATLSDTELDATIEHLISSRSGIYHPAAYEPRSMQVNRPTRGSARPGEKFFYNNWDFNTLVTIFNQETDQDFFEAFMRDIAKPIGMEDFRMEDMHYRTEPDKSFHPAYLFKMSSRDLARFGQLYLNKGMWKGERIIPKNWIEKSTSPISYTEGSGGRDTYGFLWWIDNQSFDETAFYASGLGGHRLYVLPESELVVVHRVNTYLMESETDINIINLIQNVIAAKTRKPASKPVLIPFIPEISSRNEVQVAGNILKNYVGTYTHPFFKEITVAVEDGILKMTGEILGNFRLIPRSESEFTVEDIPELPLEMVETNDESMQGTSITEVDHQRIPTKIIFYY